MTGACCCQSLSCRSAQGTSNGNGPIQRRMLLNAAAQSQTPKASHLTPGTNSSIKAAATGTADQQPRSQTYHGATNKPIAKGATLGPHSETTSRDAAALRVAVSQSASKIDGCITGSYCDEDQGRYHFCCVSVDSSRFYGCQYMRETCNIYSVRPVSACCF